MKKYLTLILTALMIVVLPVGCKKDNTEKVTQADTLKIVTTIFPEYDWVRQIAGDNIEHTDIQLLLKNGVDLHSYQPNTKDLTAISEADIFIYVGGHSDTWVEDALKDPVNKERIVINLFDVLDGELKPMMETEGMEHHHHEDHEDHDDHHHEDEYDEHVWLSLPRAVKAVDFIAEEMGKADKDRAKDYRENADKYIYELESLDQEYRQVIDDGTINTLIFADRFPFFYMTDDYGLYYYAAFSGCSADAEASFETISILANKIDELGLKHVLTIENRSHRIPETVIEHTKTGDQTILTLNSLQSVTEQDLKDGINYMDVMTDNLQILSEALK